MESSTEKVDKYRSFMYGEGEKNTTWVFGAPPNFDIVDKFFEQGRTKIWPAGSLEEKVQNLVKTMEMELFHKADPQDYKSLDASKYTFSVNGRKPLTLKEVGEMGGGYNGFLQTSLPEELRLYDPAKETRESAHHLFRTAFPRGFAFEILQVYSGPPVIAYKFRHWAYMEGPFKGHPPTGELVELFGCAIFEVDEQMRIIKVEFFYDRGELLSALTKGTKVEGSDADMKMGCPFLSKTG
ncbi:pathogen-related protein-like [Chenopodium quinoa]|uniref:pathogen-related protein-like n=1 Tax=Chenopodium quinoa TaxID=63459 RepID=UPI000B790FB6|nr:pathogen-related protein-like [Chenopodium quinoa]